MIKIQPPASRSKVLTHCHHFPEPDEIHIIVRQSPEGIYTVVGIEAQSPDGNTFTAGTLRKAYDDLLVLKYPSPDLPTLKWDLYRSNWRNPATHALDMIRLRESGKPATWLLDLAAEAVFMTPEGSGPTTDLRASLSSGPTGPAPIPSNRQWPTCSKCGASYIFSQSLDMRDLSFTPQLPGTTMVIFVCNDCHLDGQWTDCSQVIWLPADEKLILIDNGDPQPLMQYGQWYGGDGPAPWQLPKDIQDKFFDESLDPSLYFPPWFCAKDGTKAGGMPSYLQNEEIPQDSEGNLMQYIAQIATPEHIVAGGFGYIYHSTATGETSIEFQDT